MRNSDQFVRITFQFAHNSGQYSIFNDQFFNYYKVFGFNSKKSDLHDVLIFIIFFAQCSP